jgi:ubiquinone/menaquinone biosynthesis C-methylase UbiE
MKNQRIKDSLETWNAIAQSFNHTRKKTWKFCEEHIHTFNPNSICVDLGCGNGRHLTLLAQQCNQVIGFDISQNLLRIAENRLNKNSIRNTTLIQGDLCHLPFQPNSIDHIIYIAALHNIKQKNNRLQSLHEVYQTLKPKGTALISVWKKDQDRFKKQRKTDKHVEEQGDIIVYWRQHSLNIPRFYHLYQKQEFIEELEQVDFKILEIKEIALASKESTDNYYAIVQKP